MSPGGPFTAPDGPFTAPDGPFTAPDSAFTAPDRTFWRNSSQPGGLSGGGRECKLESNSGFIIAALF